MIRFSRLFASFGHALRGVVLVFKTEQSFRVQVVVAALTVGLAAWVNIRPSEWIVIILLIGGVLVLELANSVFERLVDTFKPRIHPAVHDMKDLMAGAVLIGSFVAAAIGLMIFVPYLLDLFSPFSDLDQLGLP